MSWTDPFVPTSPATGEFSELVSALRQVQEQLTRSTPPPDVCRALSGSLLATAAALQPYVADEDTQFAGRIWAEAGRGQALAPPIHFETIGPLHVAASVTFGRFHAGRSAVHGGVLPLVFDEVMARLANSQGRPRARTASLKVDYRRVVPLHQPIRVEAHLAEQDGRKRHLQARMTHADHVLAECTGLWVALRPGQS